MRPFPWLTQFGSATAAIRAMGKDRSPNLILLVSRPSRDPSGVVRRLQTAAPGAQVVTLSVWNRKRSIKECLRRLVLESTMPPRTEDEPPSNPYAISRREREVLRCMVAGLIKKEVAEYLSLSYHTVDNHERHLYHKLKVHNRTAAVAKAVMEGLC